MRRNWLLTAASAIATGIWTMHFTAMLGFGVRGTDIRARSPSAHPGGPRAPAPRRPPSPVRGRRAHAGPPADEGPPPPAGPAGPGAPRPRGPSGPRTVRAKIICLLMVPVVSLLAAAGAEVPSQDRFWFLWDELAQGALGAVVLADTRRLEDCFPAVDYFEHRKVLFVVAVNGFAGARRHDARDVCRALDLDQGTPVVLCDARERDPGREVLIQLVEYAGRMHTARLLDSVG
ncbi:GTP-binding protein [Streptomyces albogriseolus]|uniref:GTP-binding protein n=1 Tax=Streptomyces albogriseolus TaxID=1887 RepID=UPI003789ACD1